MKEIIIDLIDKGADLSLLLKSIPLVKSETNFYGFTVDKYTFNDETSILVLWNKII